MAGDQVSSQPLDVREVDVVAPNFKRRLSGVTSTIIQLLPLQQKLGTRIAGLGPGLPGTLPHVRTRHAWRLLGRPRHGQRRVWHARRNVEMAAGVILRHLFRAPLRLLFTSAAQRKHKPFTRWLIRRMDAVVATSRKAGAYLEVPHTVVMHGIDTERFTPPTNKRALKQSLGFDPDLKLIGCCGRIRHQKGTDLFVEAMIELLPQRPDWCAVFSGRTTAEHAGFLQKLQQQIADAGLSERIRYVGEHPRITELFQSFSLYIAPPRWEGFGLTPLEAMACGVPTVATDAGAFSELIVEGRTGSVVERDNVAALVAAAAPYLDDEELREQASGTAIEHVRANFPLSREAESLNRIYAELLGQDIDQPLRAAA
ncbi:MAG: glycosyltransferase family 1 protein [Planctomycetota bacterium]|nr:MAG: glycosyltransferase family 1 protein [Planctomycetota bacterium]REJ89313.1 MAG: glycosyltransferase family 1 protein [Planctomycetota bacterium]